MQNFVTKKILKISWKCEMFRNVIRFIPSYRSFKEIVVSRDKKELNSACRDIENDIQRLNDFLLFLASDNPINETMTTIYLQLSLKAF